MNNPLRRYLIIGIVIILSCVAVPIIIYLAKQPPSYRRTCKAVEKYLSNRVYEIESFVPQDTYVTEEDYYRDLIALSEIYISSCSQANSLTSGPKWNELNDKYNFFRFLKLVNRVELAEVSDRQMIDEKAENLSVEMQNRAAIVFPEDELIANYALDADSLEMLGYMVEEKNKGESLIYYLLLLHEFQGNDSGENREELWKIQLRYPNKKYKLCEKIMTVCYPDEVIQACLAGIKPDIWVTECGYSMRLQFMFCAKYLEKVGNGKYDEEIEKGWEKIDSEYRQYVVWHRNTDSSSSGSGSSSSGSSSTGSSSSTYHITIHNYDDEVDNYDSAEDYADDWADDFDSWDDAYDYYNDNN